MKSFGEIQKEKKPGDYKIIAKATNQSVHSVRAKVTGKREDNHSIVKRAFTILFECRANAERTALKKIRKEIKIF